MTKSGRKIRVHKTRADKQARRNSSRKKWLRRAAKVAVAAAALGTVYVGYKGYQGYKERALAAEAAEKAAAAQLALDQATSELAAKEKESHRATQKAAAAEQFAAQQGARLAVHDSTVRVWGKNVVNRHLSAEAETAKAAADKAALFADKAAAAQTAAEEAAQTVDKAAATKRAADQAAQTAAETVTHHAEEERTNDIKLFHKPAFTHADAQTHFNATQPRVEEEFKAMGKKFSLKEEGPFYASAAALLVTSKELLLAGEGSFFRELLKFQKAGFFQKTLAKTTCSALGLAYLYSRVETLFKRLRQDKNETANESFKHVFQHVIDVPGKNGSLRDVAKANDHDAYEYFNEILPKQAGGTRRTSMKRNQTARVK